VRAPRASPLDPGRSRAEQPARGPTGSRTLSDCRAQVLLIGLEPDWRAWNSAPQARGPGRAPPVASWGSWTAPFCGAASPRDQNALGAATNLPPAAAPIGEQAMLATIDTELQPAYVRDQLAEGLRPSNPKRPLKGALRNAQRQPIVAMIFSFPGSGG